MVETTPVVERPLVDGQSATPWSEGGQRLERRCGQRSPHPGRRHIGTGPPRRVVALPLRPRRTRCRLHGSRAQRSSGVGRTRVPTASCVPVLTPRDWQWQIRPIVAGR